MLKKHLTGLDNKLSICYNDSRWGEVKLWRVT